RYNFVMAALSQSPEQSRRPRDLQRRPRSQSRATPDQGQREQDQRQQQQASPDQAVRDERTSLHCKPGMKSDETDDNSTERGQRSHASEHSRQRGVAGLTLDLVFGPADLPIDVGTDRAAQRSEHQLRPRDIIPMMTPTSSAPAIVPRGLRLAMLSSSDARVLACSLAAEASSDPASVTPLVALPTCEATVWLMLRAVFATSPPTCDASRANVSFRPATSRPRLLISARRPWGERCSGST